MAVQRGAGRTDYAVSDLGDARIELADRILEFAPCADEYDNAVVKAFGFKIKFRLVFKIRE